MVLERVSVEAGRVHHHDVRASAHLQATGVEAVELGQFAGELVHGLLGGQERLAGLLGPEDTLHQPHAEVVERHVPQMRPGIGEADRHAWRLDELVGDLFARVGDGGGPAEVGAVLHHQIQECVGGVQCAGPGHVADGLPDQGLIGAGHDQGVVEIAVPHAR